MDKVQDAFEGQSMELVQTNLSDQQAADPREVVGQ